MFEASDSRWDSWELWEPYGSQVRRQKCPVECCNRMLFVLAQVIPFAVTSFSIVNYMCCAKWMAGRHTEILPWLDERLLRLTWLITIPVWRQWCTSSSRGQIEWREIRIVLYLIRSHIMYVACIQNQNTQHHHGLCQVVGKEIDALHNRSSLDDVTLHIGYITPKHIRWWWCLPVCIYYHFVNDMRTSSTFVFRFDSLSSNNVMKVFYILTSSFS